MRLTVGARVRVRQTGIFGRVVEIFTGEEVSRPAVAIIRRQDSGGMRYAERVAELEAVR